MVLYFGEFPLTPLVFALLIPLVYSLTKDRKKLKTVSLIVLCSTASIVSYPLVTYLSKAIPFVGYSLGKFTIFVLFPIVTVLYIEGWSIKGILLTLGVRKRNANKSVTYGIFAAAVTIIITLFVSNVSQFDLVYRTIMFLEAFTEEFFFRGFLFLYLLKKTNRKVAYATSILGFVLIHPQHFTSTFLLSTITQSILMTIIADKTENIIGPWVSHGLNRFVPAFIRIFIAV